MAKFLTKISKTPLEK